MCIGSYQKQKQLFWSKIYKNQEKKRTQESNHSYCKDDACQYLSYDSYWKKFNPSDYESFKNPKPQKEKNNYTVETALDFLKSQGFDVSTIQDIPK
ncbi:MAG: hypothetical protein V8R64_02560 [Thomasclavelia sp.]